MLDVSYYELYRNYTTRTIQNRITDLQDILSSLENRGSMNMKPKRRINIVRIEEVCISLNILRNKLVNYKQNGKKKFKTYPVS